MLQPRLIKAQTQVAHLPRLGKIKIGEKDESGTRPTGLDYFRFTSDVPERVARLEALLRRLPGNEEKIVWLPVTFWGDDDRQNCFHFLELRKGSQVVARGDGRFFERSTAKDGFVLEDSEQHGGAAAYMERLKRLAGPKDDWREVLEVQVVILGFPEIGVWVLRTAGGKTSIPAISGIYYNVKERAGRIAGLPFKLVVSQHKSNRVEAVRQYVVASLILDLSAERVDQVRELGAGLTGIVTEEKIAAAALPSGLPAAAATPTTAPDYVDFEDLPQGEEEDPVEAYLAAFGTPKTPGDFTQIATSIGRDFPKGSPDRAFGLKVWERLKKAATASGLAWDVDSLQFRQFYPAK
jgi:hypothetical protein